MIFLWFLLCWFTVTALHEVSHAITAWGGGCKHIRIYPFWHWVDTRGPYFMGGQTLQAIWNPPPKEYRRLYFARMTYEGQLPTTPRSVMHVAPLIASASVCTTNVGIILLSDGDYAYQLVMIGCALVDSAVWVYGYFFGGPHTDGQRFRYGMGIDT